MGKIIIDEIEPGMVLAGDALSSDNRVLLTAGTQVTRNHIRVLKSWGVVDVDVKGVSREELEKQLVASVDPEKYAVVQADMKYMFSHTDQAHAPVAELRYICTLRKLDKLLQGS